MTGPTRKLVCPSCGWDGSTDGQHDGWFRYLEEVTNERRVEGFTPDGRLLIAAEDHIASSVWWVVLLGSGLTIGLTFLFGMESYKMHALLTSVGAASLALVVVLIAAFDYPFRGEVQISPHAFENVRHNMERNGLVVHLEQGQK